MEKSNNEFVICFTESMQHSSTLSNISQFNLILFRFYCSHKLQGLETMKNAKITMQSYTFKICANSELLIQFSCYLHKSMLKTIVKLYKFYLYPVYEEFVCKKLRRHLTTYFVLDIANEQGLEIGDFENEIFTKQNLKGTQIFLRIKF